MKWLCKLFVSNAAGRKMWMWRIACHAKLRNSWTKSQVLEVFCETKFSIAPNDFWKVWTIHLLAHVSCRLLVFYCFQVRRLWSGTWLSRMDGLQMICDKFGVRVNHPDHFSEICGLMHFEFRSGECWFETNDAIVVCQMQSWRCNHWREIFCGLFSYQVLLRILILCLCNKQLIFFWKIFLKGPFSFF